jgi:predicted RNase H-like HicB family nuclease
MYTAIFSLENGVHVVGFPDLPGCHTCGDTLEKAVDMARDALCLWLYELEERKSIIPPATHPSGFQITDDEFLLAVSADTDEYRRYYDNKLVKKTLNIPVWLNAKGEAANVNFSQLLQKALKAELNLTTD